MFISMTYHETQESLISSLDKEKKYLLLVAEQSNFSYELLPKDFIFYGGIFPYVIYEGKHNKSGMVLVEIYEDVYVTCIPKMQYASLDNVCKDDAKSIFVILDGLSSFIVEFLENLFEITPIESKMIGGGAGKLTLQQEPVVFTNVHFLQDAALIFSSNKEMGVGVNHGWQILHGPLIATKTDKNILQELNYENAFDIYKEIVEKDSGKKLTKENFFDIAKSYPLGITIYNSEVVVRDPIMTDEKELVLVGEMDANSVVNVLKGKKENLIKAAGIASITANKHSIDESKSSLVVDCVSRLLFLEEDFTKELFEIKKHTKPYLKQWGMLSLGEIANANERNIEFYNKTCVVGVL